MILFGEWPDAKRLAAWLWVPLAALVAVPFLLFPAPLPERAVPIFWLCVTGGAALLALIARASWPFAALLGWALVRAFVNGFQVDMLSLNVGMVVMDAGRMRPFHLLIALAMVGLLYLLAREMSATTAKWVAYGFAVGLAVEFTLGYLNLWRIYPWMTFVVPEQMGRSMGLLTHPNYFGSFMALGLPIAWSLGGVLPALAVLAIILASWSAGPAISAAAGVALLAWPELSRRARYWLIGSLSAVTAIVMTVHEWRLSGRREVWAAVWPELMRYPVIGQGLGAWREWADHFNLKRAQQSGVYEAFATLQAHNEPYQLWFELGLIGLFLGILWLLQIGLATWITWSATDVERRRAWWQPGRVSLERAWIAVLAVGCVNALGSPTFHLPAQAAMVVFALARVQATAASILSAERERDQTWRLPAPPLPKTHRLSSITNGSRKRDRHPVEVS